MAPFDSTDDAQVAALHELDVILERETLPDDRPVPLAEFVDDIRITPRFREVHRWIVPGHGGRILGVSEVEINHVEDNQDLASVWVGVHPDARRRGIARTLLRPAVQAAAAAERPSLDSWTAVHPANEPFFERLGFGRRYLERHSRLRIADVDESLMKEWIARAEERAAGYSLVGWNGPCPDELVESYANVLHVMNTAPMERLDMEDEVFTAGRIRAKEEAWLGAGNEWWVLIARHDDTGEVAGLTEVGLRRHRPWYAVQGNTGVDPRHRDRGLGRWLKAAMVLRLLAERPGVEYVDTWNADSNRPMLNINEAMGFTPVRYVGGWQARLETVAGHLGPAST